MRKPGDTGIEAKKNRSFVGTVPAPEGAMKTQLL